LFGTWQGNKLSAGGFSAQRSGGETPVEGGGKFDQVQKPKTKTIPNLRWIIVGRMHDEYFCL